MTDLKNLDVPLEIPLAGEYIRNRALEFLKEADELNKAIAQIAQLQDRALQLRRYARWYMEAADTLNRNVHESTIPLETADETE